MNRRVAASVAFLVSAVVVSAVVWWLIGSGLAWLAAQAFQWFNG